MNDKDLQELVNNFRAYKASGDTNGIFGRDEPYDRPSSAKFVELMHIHLRSENIKPWIWNNIRISQFSKTSDSALVYVSGAVSDDTYLLITVFHSNAHKMAEKITFMCELAEIAERFRERF